jgi:hypothetical protein
MVNAFDENIRRRSLVFVCELLTQDTLERRTHFFRRVLITLPDEKSLKEKLAKLRS